MSDDLETEEEPQENPNIRLLREKARKADEAEQRAAAAERRLAFAEAGIDLADSRASYFIKGYDGELDPAAIRAEAEKHGFLNAPKVPEEPTVPTDEQAALERMASATEGPTTPSVDNPDDLNEFYRTNDHLSVEEFNLQLGRHLAKQGKMVSYDGGPLPE